MPAICRASASRKKLYAYLCPSICKFVNHAYMQTCSFFLSGNLYSSPCCWIQKTTDLVGFFFKISPIICFYGFAYCFSILNSVIAWDSCPLISGYSFAVAQWWTLMSCEALGLAKQPYLGHLSNLVPSFAKV